MFRSNPQHENMVIISGDASSVIGVPDRITAFGSVLTRKVGRTWVPLVAISSARSSDTVPVSEMKAILAGLRKIADLLHFQPREDWIELAEFVIRSDSQPCCDILNGVVKPYTKDVVFCIVAFETIEALLELQLKTIVSVVWTPREDNEVADCIAGWARSEGWDSGGWVDWEVMEFWLTD